jgi:hypothetical protein
MKDIVPIKNSKIVYFIILFCFSSNFSNAMKGALVARSGSNLNPPIALSVDQCTTILFFFGILFAFFFLKNSIKK